jgi:PAS domain S-box-containing protein
MPLLRKSLNVLIVEDNPNDLELILHALRHGGYDPIYRCVDNAAALNSALQVQPWEVILCDYALPRFSGLEALRTIREIHRLDVPFIFVSGAIGEEAAVTLMRAGAQDFVRKDNPSRVVAAIERELNAAETRRNKRQMDEKLEVERQLLRQLMAGIPDAIYFKDRQHRYNHLNDAERLHLNVGSDEEVLGKTADVFVSPERARILWQEEEKLFSTGEPLIDRIEKDVHADGTVRWFSATRAPIRNHRGEIIGLVGITRDITEHKRHEQMKDEFIATVSHELRTPLTSIAGSLGLLAGGGIGALPDSAMRLIEIAHTNCRRLAHLVNDILDIQKIETGTMAFDLKPLEIRALVERAIETNRDFAAGYSVSLRLDEAAANGAVIADPERLTQVVTNLLSNAVKFSPRDAEVTVTIENRGTTVRISVRDHGPGIPDEYNDRIFEKFVQVDASDARHRGGTGLGLSIVKQIALQLDGTVDFEAAPGGGTIFHVVLPTSEQAISADAGRKEPATRIAL